MAIENPTGSKNRGRPWLVRTAATFWVVLLVVSTAGWFYFLGKIGRALFNWIST
jgi:hypothetical protein